ncbi:hypothetical protein E3N88_28152 [Mikania micrantha]|uniref:Cytochrome c oxidase subunit 5C n=1 Tax=Mikania micrantha TaxID=192012 RepID=A0A5N6MZA3_9ASTR|nr:hypothetical protein E3N88_28152 [Mikania micrantha]
MKKCPNWVRIPTVQTRVSKRSKASSTDSPGTSDARVHIDLNDLDDEEEDDDEIEDLTRPIGRYRAKTDRAKARRGSSSQTTPDYNQGMENLSQRIRFLNLPSLDLIYSSYKSKMAGAPPGTAKMIIKEIAIASVLGYICASAWKYTYHRDLTKRTKSFYNMLDKGEITVVVLDD